MKKGLKDYLWITFGIILVAIGFEYFLAPNDLAAGGVTGLAILVNHYIPALSNGLIVMIVNCILFVAAFLIIGGNFGAKTIYASFGLSLVMWFMEKFMHPYAITTDLIIATIFGTLISAIGMAIVFNSNSSTGGTDILAKLINKFFHIDIGKALLLVDLVITSFAAVVFGIDKGLYALVAVIGLGIIIDNLIEGLNTVKELKIITSKSEEVRRFILEDLERGCTFIPAVGGYKKHDIVIIYTVLGRNEFIKFKKFMKVEDPDAFITVNEVHEVVGEGFKDLNDV